MQNKRQSQVGELVKRNFSQVLLDKGRYIYQDALVSVTQVQMSNDLRYAKIYLSIYNSDDKVLIMQQIENEKSRLKNSLAFRIRKHVRRIPEIDFYLDDTLDEIDRLNDLFDEIRKEEG